MTMSEANFTESEETAILRFLRYPDWQSLAQSMQLGYPAASQPLFLVRDSFKRMTGPARAKIREDLAELERIEAQLSEARSRYKMRRVGGSDSVEFNSKEERQLLIADLKLWTQRLADDLGVVVNPYSQGAYEGIGGGINAKVSS